MSAMDSGVAAPEVVAAVLREEVLHFYSERGEVLSGPAGLNTLETNSGLAEGRAQAMIDLLARRLGVAELTELRLLDVGAGFGALSIVFAIRGAQVTAVDPNTERMTVGSRAASRLGLAVAFQEGSAEDLPLGDGSVDAVVMNNSLCYIVQSADRRRALSEALRVLRPGGAIAVRNPNRLYPVDQFTGLPFVHWLPPRPAHKVATRLKGHRSYVRLETPRAAKRELARAGFEAVAYEGVARRLATRVLKRFARYQHLSANRPA
jgi:ubiquinone/menaquinone biosynthesis C-methylase UbiE